MTRLNAEHLRDALTGFVWALKSFLHVVGLGDFRRAAWYARSMKSWAGDAEGLCRWFRDKLRRGSYRYVIDTRDDGRLLLPGSSRTAEFLGSYRGRLDRAPEGILAFVVSPAGRLVTAHVDRFPE